MIVLALILLIALWPLPERPPAIRYLDTLF